MKLQSYFFVLYQLIRVDLRLLKKVLVDKIINVFIWVSVSGFVYAYIMPEFGIHLAFKQLLIIGLIASAPLFEVFPGIMNLITDINGERLIDFYATLPIPSWVMFLRYVIFYFVNASIIGFLVLCSVVVMFFNDIPWTQAQPFFALIALIMTSMFCASLVLWVAAMVRGIENVDNVWIRFIFPLWFLGGFQFSWYGLYKAFPLFAKIDLLNPYIYVMEINRVAYLGQLGYLPLWPSVGALFICIIFFLIHGIHRMRRYLDFI